jgi:hypothetical protein
MIYLDGVAIVKLVRAETHSADLVEWINARPTVPLVASPVVEVELPRALRPPRPRHSRVCRRCWRGCTGSRSTRVFEQLPGPTGSPTCAAWMRFAWQPRSWSAQAAARSWRHS